jgi:hypothetical protein
MKITVKLNQNDFVPYLRIVNRRLAELSKANSKLFISNVIVWIFLGIAVAAYSSLYRKYPYTFYDLNVVVIFLGVGVLFKVADLYYKQNLYRKVMFSQQGSFLEEQSIEMNADGMNISGSHKNSSYSWPAFIHFAEDTMNLYLFIDNAQAIILPRDALGSIENIAQVKAWLKV